MNASEEEHKKEATDLLEILLNTTAHSSYFSKLHFGKKKNSYTLTNQYYTWLY